MGLVKIIIVLILIGVGWWGYNKYIRKKGGEPGKLADEPGFWQRLWKDSDDDELTDEERKRRAIKETIEAVVIALVLALFIRTFFVQAFKIPSGSMKETLLVGDHLLVNKASYGLQVPRPAWIKVFGISVPFFETYLMPWWGEIKRGDVVVFRPPHEPDKDYIKRVIGLPGDEVQIKKNRVYVNGNLVDEPYAVFKGAMGRGGGFGHEDYNFDPLIVPEGGLFFMGDNRDRSRDSRSWGTASISDVRGRAFIIYWSRDSSKSWFKGVRRGRFLEADIFKNPYSIKSGDDE